MDIEFETAGRKTLWTGTAESPLFPRLSGNISTDVCIVGAGISGLTIAYLLAQEGVNVVVLEDGTIASGETSRTTAHLSNVLDDRYTFLIKRHGLTGAQLAAQSHTSAIHLIEDIVHKEGFDCEFERVDGILFGGEGGNEKELIAEWEACQKVGLQNATRLPRGPWATFDTGPCLLFPNQAQFHPLKYISNLAKSISSRKGRLFAYTHAAEFSGGSEAFVKSSEGHMVRANAVVLATNSPINNRVAIHTKQAAYRSYVIGVSVPKGDVPHVLGWDTGDPYHYIRVAKDPKRKDGEILVVGGEDQKTGQEKNDSFSKLEEWTRRRFPSAGPSLFQWSGQIMEPVDGLAFIGRNPQDERNVYIVTGDSGNGLTHGTIAGMLIRDLILGRENKWEKLYDPGRISFMSSKKFLRENANVVPQYADWLAPGEISSEEDLERGRGAVMREGMRKVAVYKDEDGKAHFFSAVCPHLKCIVRWNQNEKTWDCPCHGSRFDSYGRVINGPANQNLKPHSSKPILSQPPS